MPRFTRAELESYRDAEVPDLAGPGMRLLFVGINPGLMTAATGIHFGNPGNRFRPALVEAGLLRRATARADELTKAELAEGGARLDAFVAAHRPRVVAVIGVTASRRTAAPSPCRRRRSAGSRAACRAPSCGWCPTRAG